METFGDLVAEKFQKYQNSITCIDEKQQQFPMSGNLIKQLEMELFEGRRDAKNSILGSRFRYIPEFSLYLTILSKIIDWIQQFERSLDSKVFKALLLLVQTQAASCGGTSITNR